MSNILYLISGSTPTTFETNFQSLFTGTLGFTLTTQNAIGYVSGDSAAHDCVVVSSEVSVNVSSHPEIKSTTKPVISLNAALSVSRLSMAGGSGNTVGVNDIEIYDAVHPMADGNPLGVLTVFSIASDLDRIFTTPATVERIAGPLAAPNPATSSYSYFAAIGSNDDDSVPFVGDRIYLFSSATMDPDSLNASGQGMYQAAINFAIGGAVVVPKLDGTLTPWDTQIPAANLTGVKFSVRSDLQTSDNQVLSGTTTTNASGQFSIEDAALSALTTYYVTFENAAGTVFATHKITTD